jgi:hypothetical protein
MYSARLCGLSTRISRDLYDLLCGHAKAEGLTLSSLCAQILEDSIGPSRAGEAEPPAASALADVMERLETIERRIELQWAILVSGGEASTLCESLPCPRCGSTNLNYLQTARSTEPDGNTDSSVICESCSWYVPITDAAAGQRCGQSAGEEGDHHAHEVDP